ncbi:hypothetical protein FACS1894186_3490 [Alphaproteobacteria bacterium]|nr:hypothetical protein FACS1894186_3490 [Alphaproteobacteria bacterium]
MKKFALIVALLAVAFGVSACANRCGGNCQRQAGCNCRPVTIFECN